MDTLTVLMARMNRTAVSGKMTPLCFPWDNIQDLASRKTTNGAEMTRNVIYRTLDKNEKHNLLPPFSNKSLGHKGGNISRALYRIYGIDEKDYG